MPRRDPVHGATACMMQRPFKVLLKRLRDLRSHPQLSHCYIRWSISVDAVMQPELARLMSSETALPKLIQRLIRSSANHTVTATQYTTYPLYDPVHKRKEQQGAHHLQLILLQPHVPSAGPPGSCAGTNITRPSQQVTRAHACTPKGIGLN